MKSSASRIRFFLAWSLFQGLFAFAAWQPGLRCGFQVAGQRKFDLPPIWTNAALDTVAATNWCGSTISSTNPVVTLKDGTTSVWSSSRNWSYWGQIRLPAGEVSFQGGIDDYIELELDGEKVLFPGACSSMSAKRRFEQEGWHDFILRVGDKGGGAGPVKSLPFGFCIKEPGAAEWIYPADDGRMTRYRYDDGTPFVDRLHVRGLPADVGEVSPAYGLHEGHVGGETIACSAPATWQGPGIAATLVGYVIRTNAETMAEWRRGTDAVFSFDHPGADTFLEWEYECRYEVAFEAGPGGTVSTPGGTFAHGAEVSASALPGAGKSFLGWTGDLPAGCDPLSPTLAFSAGAPCRLTANFSADKLADKTYTGPSKGSWDDPANWTPAGVPTFSDAVHVPAKIRVAVPVTAYAGSLTISNNAAVSLFGASTERNESVYFTFSSELGNSRRAASDRGREAARFDGEEGPLLRIAGDVRLLDSAGLFVGGHFQQGKGRVVVGGDFSLAPKASFDVYAGASPAYYETMRWGAEVSVGGKTTIGNGAVVRLFNHLGRPRALMPKLGTSAPVWLDLHETHLAPGGRIESNYGLDNEAIVPAIWDGSCGDAFRGGGHGGAGGAGARNANLVPGGEPFDSLLSPILPGAYGREPNTMGGGVVLLQATKLVVDGTIDTSARLFQLFYESGGAAGGSIWLICDDFTLGEEGRLSAVGYTATRQGSYNCGGGAGGRVAVAVGLSDGQVDSLARTGETSDLSPVADLRTVYPGQVDVSGGAAILDGGPGGEGTAVFYRAQSADTVSLSVSVEPADANPVSGARPEPGMTFYTRGDSVTATALESALIGTAGNCRRPLVGYTLTDGEGNLVAEGTGASCAIPSIDKNLSLVWRYGPREYLVSADGVGSGTVEGAGWYGDGATATLTARPAADGAFRLWLSDLFLDQDAVRAPTVTFDVTAPVSFVALFSGTAAPRTTKCYTGPRKGSWDDPANWTPAGVPTYASDVHLPEKTVVDLPSSALVGSLTVSNGAVLSAFGRTTDQKEYLTLLEGYTAYVGRIARNGEATDLVTGLGVVDDVELLGSGRLTIGGFNQFRPAVLTAGGSLRASSSSLFEIYSGPTNATTVTTRSGGARVTVLGTFALEDEACAAAIGPLVTIDYERLSRIGAASIEADAVRIAEGATLSSTVGTSSRTYLTAKVLSKHSEEAGGGHGGKGGDAAGKTGGAAYDEPYAPVLPGAHGRHVSNFGGGALRVHARSIDLAGTVDVSAVYRGNDYEQSGAAGGSIWMTADDWTIGPAASLLARGQTAYRLNGTGSHVRGGGGGGRIALGRRLSPAAIESLYATGLPGSPCRKVDLVASPASFAGTIDVAPGEGVNGGEPGEAGTAWLLDGTPSGTVLMVR